MLERLFRFAYFIAWTCMVPVLSILALTVIKKWKNGLRMKLGFIDQDIKPHPIWFHAVSVGELNALIPLLGYFKGMNIVLSTSTETAQNMAQKKLEKLIASNEIQLIYMPWDHPLIINKVIEKIKPSMLVLMETEIWPSLIVKADSERIPVAIINARLADKSFDSYFALRSIFKPIFEKVSLVLAQSPSDSRKFLAMGVDKSKIYMTGNIKFAAFPLLNEKESKESKSNLGYKSDDLVFMAASTHPEEEAGMITIFQELKEKYPQLRLVIAPRHPERFDLVQALILSAAKLEVIRLSSLELDKGTSEMTFAGAYRTSYDSSSRASLPYANYREMTEYDVLLVDTIGDLTKLYGIADIAFVGGTVIETVGGHNVLEPAAYGVPVIIGDNYFKNIETVDMMKDAGALSICESFYDINLELEELINNYDRRVSMGVNAVGLINKNKKIILDTAEKLKQLLQNSFNDKVML